MFRTPPMSSYFFGLCLVAILAAVAYFSIPAASNGISILATGLFVGHFIGSFTGGSNAKTVSATRSNSQASASQSPSSNGETKTLYVGNIAFRAPQSALQELFENHGRVHSVRLMTDRQTRKPKGYGFIEMDGDAAEDALAALDGNSFFGRDLRVSIAKQQEMPSHH